MISYLRLECRLAMQPWTWVVLMAATGLRIGQVIGPSSGWISFLSITCPLIIFALAMHLLEQERRWGTKPVLGAVPRSTHGVLGLRFVLLSIPLLALPFAILSPLSALGIMAPAVLLASAALTAGVRFGVELGAGLGFAWWSLSFLAFITAASEHYVVLSWLSVIAAPQAAQNGRTMLLVARLGVTAVLLASPGVERLITWARR